MTKRIVTGITLPTFWRMKLMMLYFTIIIFIYKFYILDLSVHNFTIIYMFQSYPLKQLKLYESQFTFIKEHVVSNLQKAKKVKFKSTSAHTLGCMCLTMGNTLTMSSSLKIARFRHSRLYSRNRIWIPTRWQKARSRDARCTPYFSMAASIESLPCR